MDHEAIVMSLFTEVDEHLREVAPTVVGDVYNTRQNSGVDVFTIMRSCTECYGYHRVGVISMPAGDKAFCSQCGDVTEHETELA